MDLEVIAVGNADRADAIGLGVGEQMAIGAGDHQRLDLQQTVRSLLQEGVERVLAGRFLVGLLEQIDRGAEHDIGPFDRPVTILGKGARQIALRDAGIGQGDFAGFESEPSG